MKRFVVKIDATMEAENVDDALLKIGQYFTKVALLGTSNVDTIFHPLSSLEVSQIGPDLKP